MTNYKKQSMEAWNEIAPRYHRRWSGQSGGPHDVTNDLIRHLNIRKGSRVLDVGCGTGIATKAIGMAVGNTGQTVGTDTSISAIKIAKRHSKSPGTAFVNADAENLAFGSGTFDFVTCQHALFFFPDAPKALKNMRESLRPSGKVGIAVHGPISGVPFHGAILDAATRFVPDYLPDGAPRLDRYSTKKELNAVVRDAGFSRISIKEPVYMHCPGTFEKYWADYRRYVSKPIRAKIAALSRTEQRKFRDAVRDNVSPYVQKDGRLIFPWALLILRAMR